MFQRAARLYQVGSTPPLPAPTPSGPFGSSKFQLLLELSHILLIFSFLILFSPASASHTCSSLLLFKNT